MNHADVYQPKNLSDALSWLATAPHQSRCIAGGTDLMVVGHIGGNVPSHFIDIWSLDELRGVTEDNDALWLGALTTYTEMIQHEKIQKHIPLLSQAARSVGAIAIQNRGTLGGNIVNASPAGDTLPVLFAHNAEIEVESVSGKRLIPATSFYQGYKKLDLLPSEIVTRVKIPKQQPNEKSLWIKVGQRKAQAISKVMLAGRALVESGTIQWITLSLGSVAPTPIRLFATEQSLNGKTISSQLLETARQSARNEVKPISDVRSTEEYRKEVSGNLVARFLRILEK